MGTRTLGYLRVDGTAALYAEPGCVALAKTTAEVTQVVRYAARNKIPVVTRGSGTGLSGGSVPVHGCIVLCLVQWTGCSNSTKRTSPFTSRAAW